MISLLIGLLQFTQGHVWKNDHVKAIVNSKEIEVNREGRFAFTEPTATVPTLAVKGLDPSNPEPIVLSCKSTKNESPWEIQEQRLQVIVADVERIGLLSIGEFNEDVDLQRSLGVVPITNSPTRRGVTKLPTRIPTRTPTISSYGNVYQYSQGSCTYPIGTLTAKSYQRSTECLSLPDGNFGRFDCTIAKSLLVSSTLADCRNMVINAILNTPTCISNANGYAVYNCGSTRPTEKPTKKPTRSPGTVSPTRLPIRSPTSHPIYSQVMYSVYETGNCGSYSNYGGSDYLSQAQSYCGVYQAVYVKMTCEGRNIYQLYSTEADCQNNVPIFTGTMPFCVETSSQPAVIVFSCATRSPSKSPSLPSRKTYAPSNRKTLSPTQRLTSSPSLSHSVTAHYFVDGSCGNPIGELIATSYVPTGSCQDLGSGAVKFVCDFLNSLYMYSSMNDCVMGNGYYVLTTPFCHDFGSSGGYIVYNCGTFTPTKLPTKATIG
jgi:hypothetical protein